MAGIKIFRDLEIWNLAIEMVDCIYEITEHFPKTEQFGLTSQIRKSAVSVPSNIAEGSARNNTKELIQFIYIARGSLAELETQMEIAMRRKFCNEDVWQNLQSYFKRISQMSSRLIQSLQT